MPFSLRISLIGARTPVYLASPPTNCAMLRTATTYSGCVAITTATRFAASRLIPVDLLLAVLFVERRPILVELLLDLLRQPHGG